MDLVLMLFTGEWCHACKQLSPVVKQVVQEFPDKIELKVVDISQEPDLATKYEVLSIPTLIILQGGQVLEKITGFISKDKLTGKINSYLK